MHDVHIGHRHAQPIRDQLRQRRLMPLAMAMRARQHGDRAGGMHADHPHLIQPRPRTQRSHHRRGCYAAGLNIGGNTNAPQFSMGSRRSPPRLKTRPIRSLHRHIQRREIIAAVILQRDRRLVRELIRPDEIAPTNGNLVDPRLARRHIDQPLNQEGRLRPASAAIGIHRHGVGEHRLHLGIDRRRLVAAGQQRGVEIGRHRGGEGGKISAHIGLRYHTKAQESALFIQGQLSLGDMIPAMRIGHEGFSAVRRPLDRQIHLGRRPGDGRLFDVMENLRAKAAAHIRRHNPQLALRNIQHKGAHQQPDHMRILAGGVERVLIGGGVIIANRRARLHGIGNEPVVHQLKLHHMLGLGEGRIRRRLVANMPIVTNIGRDIIMHRRRAERLGLMHIRRRRQHVVIDDNGLGSIARLRPAGRHHQRHRIAHKAHLALGQHRVRRLGHGRAILVVDLPATGHAADLIGRHILAGENRNHPRHGPRSGEVERPDPRMRMRAAQKPGIGLARAIDIIGVMAAAGEETQIFLASHAGANALKGDDGVHVVRSLCGHATCAGGLAPQTYRAPRIRRAAEKSLGGGGDGLALAMHHIGRGSDGLHYIVVAGAAAEIAFQTLPDFPLAQPLRVLLHQVNGAHHHARRAETTLKRMILTKRLLHRVQGAIGRGQALNRGDRGAIAHHRQGGAGLHRFAIDMDHAGPALAGVAADMRAGQPQLFAQQFDQQGAALDRHAVALAVHRECDLRHVPPPVVE